MTPCDVDRYEQICKSEFAEIKAKLDEIDKALRGNSNPGNPGIAVRLDRLESSEARRSRLLWIIMGSTVALVINVLWNWVLKV